MSKGLYLIKVTERHINSDSLAENIKDHVKSCIESPYVKSLRSAEDREEFADTVEYFLLTLYDNKLITQGKVVFDKRNNKRVDIDRDKYTIDIYYKQWNCLNTSHIRYELSDVGNDEDIDFVAY